MSDEEGPDNVLPFPEGGVDPSAEELLPLLEALLFAAGDPVRIKDLAEAIGDDGHRVRTALGLLARRYRDAEGGVELAQVGGGWQLRTHPRFAPFVRKLRGTRPARLSNAALEVLSVVAYQQPVTRSDVEDIRGVDCGGVLRSLIDKGLIRVSGRRDEPGRPLEYRTTPGFLELFGLRGLSDMPTLESAKSSTMGDPLHESHDEIVVSESQALILGLGGFGVGLAGLFVAVIGTVVAPLAWPVAGVFGLFTSAAAAVAIRRSLTVDRVEGTERASAILLASGVINALLGVMLLMTGAMGIGMLGLGAFFWVVGVLLG